MEALEAVQQVSLESEDTSILKQFLNKYSDVNEISIILERLEDGAISDGDVFIDSWDSLTSIVILVYPPETRDRTWIRFLSIDDSKLLKVLQSLDNYKANLYDTKLLFFGEIRTTEYICHSMAPKLGNKTQRIKTSMHALGDAIPAENDVTLPDGYKIAKIKETDFELIRSKWKFSNGQDADWFKCLAQKYGAVAIYKGDEIASWTFESSSGAFLHLFTQPDHRRKGLASVVVTEMCRRMLAKGRTPFCYIVEGNTASEQFFIQVGFKLVGGRNFVIVN